MENANLVVFFLSRPSVSEHLNVHLIYVCFMFRQKQLILSLWRAPDECVFLLALELSTHELTTTIFSLTHTYTHAIRMTLSLRISSSVAMILWTCQTRIVKKIKCKNWKAKQNVTHNKTVCKSGHDWPFFREKKFLSSVICFQLLLPSMHSFYGNGGGKAEKKRGRVTLPFPFSNVNHIAFKSKWVSIQIRIKILSINNIISLKLNNNKKTINDNFFYLLYVMLCPIPCRHMKHILELSEWECVFLTLQNNGAGARFCETDKMKWQGCVDTCPKSN